MLNAVRRPPLPWPPAAADALRGLPAALRARSGRLTGVLYGQLAPGRASDGIVLAALGLLAAAARLIRIGTTYDTFVDEYFYADLGTSVAHGHFPPQTAPGSFFVLHPPGFFVLEALWTTALPFGTGYQDRIVAGRLLNITLGVLVTVLIYLLVKQLATRRIAALTALYFTCEPFVLRQNGRVLLETATLTFVVAGWLLVVRAVREPQVHPARRAVVAGLVLGCGPLTKDMAAALTTLPLLIMAVTGWGLRRWAAAAAAAASTLPYGAFLAATVVQGGQDLLWDTKLHGLRRLAGVSITTGYNAPHAKVSLVEAALGQISHFGTTYALLGLGSLAALWLLARPRRPEHRVMGLVTVCAGGLIGYSTVFGTAEEHLLYFLLVPAAVSTGVVAARLFPRRRPAPWRSRRGILRGFAAGTVALALCWNVGTWLQVRTVPDDGQQRFASWLRRNVPPGEKVAWIVGQTTYEVKDAGRVPVPMTTPAALAREKVRYLVVLHKEVEQGYTFTTAAAVAWYAARSREVFAFSGPTYGRISVYESTDLSVW